MTFPEKKKIYIYIWRVTSYLLTLIINVEKKKNQDFCKRESSIEFIQYLFEIEV